MSKVLSSALKDNEFFYKAVITGILRIVKESIFSGLNHTGVYSFQTPQYSDAFGFTAEEVRHLIAQRPMETHEAEFQALSGWYNGYECGGITIYNPWSIACYMKNHQFLPYWTNTGRDDIFRRVLNTNSRHLMESFSQLVLTSKINKPLSEFLDFGALEIDPDQIWSIMVASGYLKVIGPDVLSSGDHILVPPNYQVAAALKILATSVLMPSGPALSFIQGIGMLAEGNAQKIIDALQTIFERSISFHDLQRGGENFADGVILGVLASLHERFDVQSNKESCQGRYDIALFPRENNPKKLGIIIELKMDKILYKKKKFDSDIYGDQLR